MTEQYGTLNGEEITRETHPELFKLLDSVERRAVATEWKLPEVKLQVKP